MEVFKEDEKKILLLTPVPFELELLCIKCSVKQPIVSKSLMHWKILKCRMLIFTEVRIIASPNEGFENEICVIMSKSYYETGKIFSHFNRLDLIVEKTMQVTKRTYETCLQYTMMARIAPLWNQMASFLVCGRNFLLQKEPLLAVTLDVFVIGKEMSIAIWPHRIHKYAVQLRDLLEGKEEMIDVLPEIIVNDGKWVHVLPSLKKAYVISVSKHIPKNSPFLSYKQLKRHWKNNYGYRLPEVEMDIPFYVNVSFSNNRPKWEENGWLGTVYTYPSLCICQCPPVILGSKNQATPLKIFLEDLSNRMPQVCDHPFAGNEAEFGFAVPKLHYANESTLHMKPSMIKLSRNDLIPETDIFTQTKPFTVADQRVFLCSSFPSAEQVEGETHNKMSYENEKIDTNKTNKPTYSKSNKELENIEHRRYAPVFKSKMKSTANLKHIAIKDKGNLKHTLMKKTSKEPQNLQCKDKNNLHLNSQRSNVLFKKKEMEHWIPQKDNIDKTSLVSEQKIFQPISTNIIYNLKPKSNMLHDHLLSQKDMSSPMDTSLLVREQAWKKEYKEPTNCTNKSLNASSIKEINYGHGRYFTSKIVNVGIDHKISESLIKIKNTDESTKCMKNTIPTPRNRPAVQEHLNVEALAKDGMLCKANTTTIISWLRNKGVSCRVKDKKSNLIHLVEEYLGLPSLSHTSLSQSVGSNSGH